MSNEPNARAARTVAEPLDPKHTVELESKWLLPTAIFAFVAGLVPVLTGFFASTIDRSALEDPQKPLTIANALSDLSAGKSDLTGIQTALILNQHENATSFITLELAVSIGILCVAPVLFLLLRGAHRRKPGFPRLVIMVSVAAVVIYGIGSIVNSVLIAGHISDFANLPVAQQTNEVARRVTADRGSAEQMFGTVIAFCAIFAAIAIGVASTLAKGVGLLPRFVGTLGIFAAFIFMFSGAAGGGGGGIFGLIRLVVPFWFFSVGLALLGRGQGGRLPAWVDGLPHPWPTRAEIMAEVERAKSSGSKPAKKSDTPAPKPKGASGSRKRK